MNYEREEKQLVQRINSMNLLIEDNLLQLRLMGLEERSQFRRQHIELVRKREDYIKQLQAIRK